MRGRRENDYIAGAETGRTVDSKMSAFNTTETPQFEPVRDGREEAKAAAAVSEFKIVEEDPSPEKAIQESISEDILAESGDADIAGSRQRWLEGEESKRAEDMGKSHIEEDILVETASQRLRRIS